MQVSPAVRAAGKEMQLKRLEMKGKKGYVEYYANQPKQLLRAAKNAELSGARTALVAARDALAVAEINGKGLAAATEQAAIAEIVFSKLAAGMDATPSVSLTTGGK